MRVLFLNPFSQAVSGPDESLAGIIGPLRKMGVEAHVALPRPGPHVERYRALGAKVHFLPLTVLKRRMSAGDIARLPFSLFRGVKSIRKLMVAEEIDLIHTNMEVVLDGSLMALLWGVPHVLHYRGNSLDRPKFAFDILCRFWTWSADQVIAISDATADLFRKRGLGRQVTALHNPVDLEAYLLAKRSDDVRHQLGAERGDLLVGTVGRIHPRKDLETFLRAASLLVPLHPRIKFVIVGSAEAPEELQYLTRLNEVVSELGLLERVHFAGVRRDMPEVFKALDLFILSSRHEGFGRVVAEAIAAGTAAIVSDEGAPPSLVGDPRCVARAGDAADFAEKAASVLDNPVAFATDPARESLRFSPFHIAQEVLSIYGRARANHSGQNE